MTDTPDIAEPTYPWERQPGETEKAYQAFCQYRDMPAGSRSLRTVSQRLYGGKPATSKTRPAGQVQDWSIRWGWVQRVQAWDDEMDRRRREAAVAEVEEMAARHARQAHAAQEAAMQPVLAILEAARTDPDFRSRLVAEGLGRTLEAALSAASKLPGLQGAERLARGEPTEITSSRHVVVETSVEDLGRTLEALRRAGVPIVVDDDN